VQFFWKFDLFYFECSYSSEPLFFLCLIKPLECGSENGVFSFIKPFGSGDFGQILELGLV
jgi:hypothetical protein